MAITVVGLVLASSVSGRLKSGIQLDSAAYTANQQIARQYGGSASDPGVVVIDLPNGTTVTSAGVAARLRGLDAEIAKRMPGFREISYASTGDQALLGNGGRSTILLVYPPAAGRDVPATVLDRLSAAAEAAVPGATVHSTGLNALASGNAARGNSSVVTELLIGSLGALIVLAWVFGSFLAAHVQPQCAERDAAACVERHDLAVEDRRLPASHVGEHLRFGERGSDVVATMRAHPYPIAVDVEESARAIPLDLRRHVEVLGRGRQRTGLGEHGLVEGQGHAIASTDPSASTTVQIGT